MVITEILIYHFYTMKLQKVSTLGGFAPGGFSQEPGDAE
jgi:hypothetical protein